MKDDEHPYVMSMGGIDAQFGVDSVTVRNGGAVPVAFTILVGNDKLPRIAKGVSRLIDAGRALGLVLSRARGARPR